MHRVKHKFLGWFALRGCRNTHPTASGKNASTATRALLCCKRVLALDIAFESYNRNRVHTPSRIQKTRDGTYYTATFVTHARSTFCRVYLGISLENTEGFLHPWKTGRAILIKALVFTSFVLESIISC